MLALRASSDIVLESENIFKLIYIFQVNLRSAYEKNKKLTIMKNKSLFLGVQDLFNHSCIILKYIEYSRPVDQITCKTLEAAITVASGCTRANNFLPGA